VSADTRAIRDRHFPRRCADIKTETPINNLSSVNLSSAKPLGDQINSLAPAEMALPASQQEGGRSYTAARHPPDVVPPPLLNPRPKREASDDSLPSLRSKRRHFQPPLQPPEPLSINSVMRGRPGSRLFVHPIQWTSEQPQLLGCRFVPKTAERRLRNVNKQQCLANNQTARNQKGQRGHSEDANPSNSAAAAVHKALGLLPRASRDFSLFVIQDLLEHYGIQWRPK
jgi:hypothetical protein